MKSYKDIKDMAIINLMTILICLYFIKVRHNEHIYLKVLIGVSIFVFLLSILYRPFAVSFLSYWLIAGKVLGRINATIILSILFFLFLIPYSFVKKLVAGFALSNAKETKSYYIRNHQYSKSDFEKLW